MDLENNFSIRRVKTHEEFLDVQNLHKIIWGLKDIDVHPKHMLIGIQNSNGLLMCAYYNKQPIGFIFGYFGLTEDLRFYLHCHNIAVLENYRNCGIGCQLLMAARNYMKIHKIPLARATFDPLESGNANLYFRKAGCICSRYIRDYYGAMSDQRNVDIPSDRLLVEYFTSSNLVNNYPDHTQLRISPKTLENLRKKALSRSGLSDINLLVPKVLDLDKEKLIQSQVKDVYIEIPSNYQEMRQKDMNLVVKWRFELRNLIEKCFDLDMVIIGFIRLKDHCYYILRLPGSFTGDDKLRE